MNFFLLFPLQRWQDSGNSGLSKETFLAVRHTCAALSECCRYLLSHLGFDFVLLGKLQSDNIESRFGWYRQLSGANYFISVREVFHSEKKIRAVSLLKFSHITIHDLDAAIEMQEDNDTPDTLKLAQEIGEKLKMDYIPSKSEENIVLYVCGAICRSTLRTTKCSSCREVLCCKSELNSEVDIDNVIDPSSCLNFQNIVTRGGLLKPTDYAYTLCIESFRVFEEIRGNEELMASFLKCSNQRQIFRRIVENVMDETTYMNAIFGHETCTQGHNVSMFTICRFFNSMMKGLTRNLTIESQVRTDVKQKATLAKRRVSKLLSQ